MKIAVSSRGAGLGAWLEPDLAKCGFLMIVDEENNFKAVENISGEMGLAEIARVEKVEALITGTLSEPAKNILHQNGIKIYLAQQGSVLELIEQVSDGKLQVLE